MNQLVVRCGSKVVFERIESRWSGEIEQNRRDFMLKWDKVFVSCLAGATLSTKAMADPSSADQIRSGFMQLIDVFTAITEPILWFYAITACILMATGKNKEMGWNRLKSVGYAYIGITLLPTFFVFLRWVSKIISESIHM